MTWSPKHACPERASRPWHEQESPSQTAQWLDHHPVHQGCRFNSQSGHILRLWFWSLNRAYMGGNWSMFLSHIDVALSLPSSFSKINKYILGWGLKEWTGHIKSRSYILHEFALALSTLNMLLIIITHCQRNRKCHWCKIILFSYKK